MADTQTAWLTLAPKSSVMRGSATATKDWSIRVINRPTHRAPRAFHTQVMLERPKTESKAGAYARSCLLGSEPRHFMENRRNSSTLGKGNELVATLQRRPERILRGALP